MRRMNEYRDKTFHNRTLTLDGQVFRGCRFINADLRYGGGAAFALDGNAYEGTLNIEIARNSPLSAAMAAVLDADLRRFGFDPGLALRLQHPGDPVLRTHTLLPRQV